MIILSDKEITKSKTAYKCIWCGGIIEKGKEYQKLTYILDGELKADPYHPDCATAASEICTDNDPYFEAYSMDYGSIHPKGETSQ